ncbi:MULTISPECIES: hypothetical protein [unclassified Bradyrhizobium]|uniref:hypothetical protein n=1 Tax=unclassified Bradyrhizobium TaxID=2631580 RepID=UPI0028EE73E6|nr:MULTISPECIES: hypothetical protein [unclassified Bradyrhizobium]
MIDETPLFVHRMRSLHDHAARADHDTRDVAKTPPVAQLRANSNNETPHDLEGFKRARRVLRCITLLDLTSTGHSP